MNTDTFEAKLPPLRCDKDLKEKLEEIAAASVSPRLSDHMRAAIQAYVDSHWSPNLTSISSRKALHHPDCTMKTQTPQPR